MDSDDLLVSWRYLKRWRALGCRADTGNLREQYHTGKISWTRVIPMLTRYARGILAWHLKQKTKSGAVSSWFRKWLYYVQSTVVVILLSQELSSSIILEYSRTDQITHKCSLLFFSVIQIILLASTSFQQLYAHCRSHFQVQIKQSDIKICI